MSGLVLPEPPPHLATIRPDVRRVRAGASLWRIYARGGAHPQRWDDFRYFGPLGSRFDHHLAGPHGEAVMQARGIYYAALGRAGPGRGTQPISACIGEVYQQTREVDRVAHAPYLASFRTARNLALLDLTGSWPIRANATAQLAIGPHEWSRRWAVAIYAAYPQLDGVYYRSAYGSGALAVALFERAIDALPPDGGADLFDRPLAHPELLPRLRRACRDLGYELR